MKAASSSEWYDTTPRHVLPRLHHPSISSLSSSPSFPGLQNRYQSHHLHPQRGPYLGDSYSSSSRYESPSFAVASSDSFSSATGTTTNSNSTESYHHTRPQRQLSKILTPTITSTSSTSFSKSYSRSSRSLSNNSTEPTAASSSEAVTEITSYSSGGNNSRPPYSFSSDANKLKNRSSLHHRQHNHSFNKRLVPGSSRDSFTSGNRVPSTPTTTLPPVILETDASEDTDVTYTEEDGYDDENEDEEDKIYQSFKQSVRMLGVPQHTHSQRSSQARSESSAVSLQSVVTDLEEDEENLPLESVDDDASSCTDDFEEAFTSSNYRSGSTVESMHRFYRSTSVPKTPVKVRVKVEKAVPQTYFDDRVKVTLQVEDEEEETEGSEVDEYSNNEEEEDGEEDEDEENSATESDATSTSTAETVRYLNRNAEGESYGESSDGESDQSGSNMFSDESGDEGMLTSNYKTDYPSQRTPLFPPINGVSRRDVSSEIDSMSSMLKSRSETTTDRNKIRIHDLVQQLSSISGSGSGTHSSKNSDISIDSAQTGTSDSSNSKTTNTSGSGETASSTVTTSNSDLSSRSQSARSSLIGRASAIHRMYSVGGKVRSLSARRSQVLHRLPSPLTSPAPRLQLSSDSTSPSASETSDSKQYLPDAHLGAIGHRNINIFPHSRSLSASSSRRRFSADLRQLSLGNIQTMNPPFPMSAAHVLAEKTFKGEGLPPITPPSPSSSSSTSTLSTKPHPLTRNLTYTVCNHPTEESDDTANALPTLPPPRSTEHITLRQLIMSDKTSSHSSEDSEKRGSEHSLSELLFPANLVNKEHKEETTSSSTSSNSKPPPQVSFATSVIEHSLSASHTLESTNSEQSGSVQKSDSASDDSSSESYYTCRLTGRRLRRLTAEEQYDLLNKDYMTYGELQQESGDEDDTSKERLRHFALDTIRKQMTMERKRIESMTEQDDEIFSDDYDFSDEEESESTEGEGSSEEEENEETPKAKPWDEASHIPVATSDALPVEEGASGEQIEGGAEAAVEGVPEKALVEGHDQAVTNQDKEDAELSVKEEEYKSFDDPTPLEEEEVFSLLPTRINSAESGYRAMPPSRAASTRENSLDPEELEKEKERLMQQWKDSGGVGDPPAITTSLHSTSSQMVYGGELITINYSRPNSATESKTQDALIQNGIDLTQELPGEEKKIAAVWEEFNRDEREGGAMADYEFSTLLDEMIMDINSYKPKLSTTGLVSNNSSQSQSLQVSTQVASSSWEQPKFDPSRKYSSLSELVALLSHNLRLVSSETLEDHMASLISLISSVLRKVRKNKTEDDYVTQIACLSAIRVLCDRLLEMTSSQNLKYADLSWLFRVLCKYSSDSESKIRSEASFCLARLVKVAGPSLVVRPIYFILVMESESGAGKTTTGAKTKAAAIDTLTYAMLTFPKEDFHNMEEIAGWVCLAMLNEERRIRQSALECLAIISQHLGGRDKALPLFHTLFLKEEMDHFSRSPSPDSFKTSKTGKSSKRTGKGSDPIPLSVHGTVRLLTGPGFPIAQPIDAITARLDKDVLPVPSTKGLIEYAVNVPTGKDLVLLMTHMLDKDDDEWDFSSSTDSMDSGSAHSKRSSVTSLGFSDIDWTGEGPEKDKNKEDTDLISPDVAYILLGKGRVNKSDVVLLDTYKKEIIPEIIQMLNDKNKRGDGKRNRRRWWKNQKNKKKRKRKGHQRRRRADGKLIPTLSFDAEDDTLPPQDDDDDEDGGPHEESVDPNEEAFDEPNSPVAVVVDPPVDDPSKSMGTEDETLKTGS